MDKTSKRSVGDKRMSLIFYLVRNKRDKGQFYSNARKHGGWVTDIRKASIWGTKNGPHQVIKILGENFAEIVPMESHLRDGEYKSIYIIRHKVTGIYIANKPHRKRGVLFTSKYGCAGTWTLLCNAKTLIRSRATFWDERYRLNPDELEIIRMPVFIPRIKHE